MSAGEVVGFRADRTSGEPIDLSGARNPQTRALMLLAHTLDGWRVHVDRKGVQFDCKHPGVSFRLPADDTLRNSIFISKVKTICRHAESGPLVRSVDLGNAIAEMVKLERSQRSAFAKAIVQTMPSDADVIETFAAQVGVEPEFDPVERHFPQLRPAIVDAPAPTLPPEPRSEGRVDPSAIESPGAMQERTGATVVKTQPYRAHQSGKRTYASDVIIERHWSDGTVDFKCARCDYTAVKHTSVGAHQKTHRMGPWVRPEADGYDPDWVPTPRVADRVEALAAELRKAFDAGHTTPDAIARFVVQERVAARQVEDDDTPSELTPEQVLARIARLVDRGETPRLQAQVDELRLTVEAVSAQAQAATLRADHAESSLRTLRDLINDEVRDEAAPSQP